MSDEHADEILRAYAARREAHRESPVTPDKWDWRDDLASAVQAQADYDRRRIAALRSGGETGPSLGWTFEDRVIARGQVDAVLATIRRFDPITRRKVFRAVRSPQQSPADPALSPSSD